MKQNWIKHLGNKNKYHIYASACCFYNLVIYVYITPLPRICSISYISIPPQEGLLEITFRSLKVGLSAMLCYVSCWQPVLHEDDTPREPTWLLHSPSLSLISSSSPSSSATPTFSANQSRRPLRHFCTYVDMKSIITQKKNEHFSLKNDGWKTAFLWKWSLF